MKKFTAKIATAALSLSLCLGTVGQVGVLAKDGPNTGAECSPYIEAMVGDVRGFEFEAICAENKGYYSSVYHDFDKLDYDKKSNTLTLNNFKGKMLSTNEMGDDLKIRLVGDSSVDNLVIWGYGYGGSVTFIGDGSLTAGRFFMQAELADAVLTVKDSAKVTVYCPDDHGLDYPSFGLFATTVGKNAINAKCSADVRVDSEDLYQTITIDYNGYDGNYPLVKKDGKSYGMFISNAIDFETGDWTVESVDILNTSGKTVDSYATVEAAEKAGYVPVVKGNSYTYRITDAKFTFTATDSSAKAEAPKKGEVITCNGHNYKVTKAGSSKSTGTVAFYEAEHGVKKLTIPASIKVDEITYKVTSIDKNACINNPTLTSVTIGKYVKTIGSKAFYNCKKLTEIKLSTSKLTKTGVKSAAFKGINSSCKVTVPSGMAKSYKTILQNAGLSSKISVK